ncbi:MAG TPA: FAD-binding oxidoreductase [Methylomirabilota bacterium]|jgi:D-lactate dehydrogenase (cytochrome)|nr:FAD-binding oxidoreductase [Methylomirabilota bacterium]
MPLADDLASLVSPDRMSTKPADLELASHDESSCPPAVPEVVVWPLSTEEVSRVVRYAYERSAPVTARGAGSSLEGNPIPVHGGIVLDLSRMDKIIAVHAEDLQVTVQPGIVYNHLNEQLKPYGLFFPPSPGGSSDVATIGGMVANNASGIYSVKYGGTRDHVKAATVVTGTGEVLRLGTRSRKTSSGYHLLGLLIGSEGTLAIATEVTLSLVGLPQGKKQGAVTFPSEKAAVSAIAEMMRYGVDLAAVEFLDRRSIAALNRFQHFGLVEQPSLFIEVHGSPHAVDDAFATATALCEEHSGQLLALPGGRNPWEVRHFTTRAIQALHPQAKTLRTDMGFPISRLPEVVEHSYAIAERHGVVLYTFGHASIGILHALIREDPADKARWQAANQAKDEIVAFVLSVGGTASGEHGIGLGSRKYVRQEHGAALDYMKGVKQVFDPKGILNPGKIW